MAEKERIGKAIGKTLNVKNGFQLAGTTVTATAAQLNTAANAAGTVAFDRSVKVARVPLTGTAIHGGVQAWQNPEATSIIITGAVLDVTTVATAAGTVEVGTTAVSATTASANLIDTLDVHTATGTFDNVTDHGTNGKSRQKLAAGKWVTFGQASGDTTGMVAVAYLYYINA